MISRAAFSALLALSLGACATVQRYDAAGDIHAFLVAIRDSDKAGFEAHVDRPALKAQLRARLMAVAMRRGDVQGDIAALAAPFVGAMIDPVVDGLVQPEVFLAIAEANGYSPSRPLPGRTVLATAIRPLEADRVCVTVKSGGPCVLIFRDEGHVWRLTAFEGPADLLKPGKLKLGLVPQ
jgi:hypothetical protein